MPCVNLRKASAKSCMIGKMKMNESNARQTADLNHKP